MGQLGKILLIFGVALVTVGALLMLGERLGLGRLPGDLVWRRRNVTIHFPIVTSLVISIVLTVVINLLLRRK